MTHSMRMVFDGFDIDTDAGQLLRAGREVPIERRALDMLCYLAAHPGRLVTKDELLSEVWRARTLSDNVLSNSAAKLRKALGQAAGAREPLETVRGRGYRWHAPPLGAAEPQPDASRFVGRARVLEVLECALGRANEGHGQVVLLTGGAGIGKTRTLDELARRATERGFGVWQGAAHDGAGAPPYWLWTEILRSAHENLSHAMFRRHMGRDSWAMSVLVPELAGTQPAALEVDARATRFRLFDEVARFVAASSGDAPRLILADDVHWADDGTLELLAFVARALGKRAVMLVVSLRDDEQPRAPALERLGRRATHVPLAGLSPSEVEELVSTLGAQLRDARSLERLYERTQGNPFFVQQIVHAHETLEQLSLPQAVRDVLRQRIGALADEAQAALRVAAVIGAEFDAALLAEVLALPLATILDALELAVRKAVVAAHATAPHRFVFCHALLRDVVYEDLELSARGGLHARLARLLARRPVAGDPRALGEIARHSLLAVPTELETCARYCRAAAAAARHALGYEAAAALLASADDKLASEGGEPATRCELLLELGADRFCAGDVRNAWRALERGAALAEQLDAPELLARFACRLVSWLEIGGGDELQVRRYVARALKAIGPVDSDLRGMLLAHRAEMCFELSVEERRALLDEAERIILCSNAPLALIEVSMRRASLRDPTRLDEARAAIDRCRELVHLYGHELAGPERLLSAFSLELSEYVRALTACDLVAADAAIERCSRVAEQSQVGAVLQGLGLMQAGRALGDGRLADLTGILTRMQEAGSLAGGFENVWSSYATRLIEVQGGIASLAGFDAALPSLDALRPSQRADAALWIARLNARIGTADTLERARVALATIPKEQLACMPARYGDLGSLCFLAETYAALGDEQGAATLYPRLLPYAELNAVLPTLEYLGAVAHYLGILSQLLGREHRAARHFEQAASINRRLRLASCA